MSTHEPLLGSGPWSSTHIYIIFVLIGETNGPPNSPSGPPGPPRPPGPLGLPGGHPLPQQPSTLIGGLLVRNKKTS